MLFSSSALATRKNNHRNTIFNLSCSRPLGDFRHNTNNEVTMKVSVIITILFLRHADLLHIHKLDSYFGHVLPVFLGDFVFMHPSVCELVDCVN